MDNVKQQYPSDETRVATHNAEDHKTVSILVVSGRSGSGKTSALNILEDFGYYTIDNLPLALVPEVADKLINDSAIYRIALGVDIRSPRADLSKFGAIRDTLQERHGKNSVRVIYVTAQESILVARFNATRRLHPLMSAENAHSISNLPGAIQKEVELLEPIASRADIKIDTSKLNIHELKECLRDHLNVANKIMVSLLSFGFKYGSPIDADFVFDVRILPNPHWNSQLRGSTGLDAPVATFFADYPEVEEMREDIGKFLARWLPDFLYNNRHTVTIAIGCTGGKHRSVFITEALAEYLQARLPEAMTISAKHREKHRW